MYSEEFDDLEETRRGPRGAYVSSVSQHDADRLLRENERLKKNLEKEKFFNRLLDQELKETKEEAASRMPDAYHNARPGVSKGAFYTLLIISLAMAGFIAYTLYYNKQYNLFNGAQFSFIPGTASTESVTQPSSSSQEAADAAAGASSSGENPAAISGNGIAGPDNPENTAGSAANTNGSSAAAANTAAPRDSVPNIIGSSAASPATSTSTSKRQSSVASLAEQEYNEAEVEAVLADLPPERPETTRQVNTASITPPPAPVVNRPVIGRYYVSSKANFYSSPDENTLRNVFITQGADKIVAALEDRNGFIYVEYKNDRGYTTRGWLSKGDLTKAE